LLVSVPIPVLPARKIFTYSKKKYFHEKNYLLEFFYLLENFLTAEKVLPA
jgi:hypothetical protein